MIISVNSVKAFDGHSFRVFSVLRCSEVIITVKWSEGFLMVTVLGFCIDSLAQGALTCGNSKFRTLLD